MPHRFTKTPLMPALCLLAVTLISGCGTSVGFATSQAICNELRVDLPTYSSHDTPQSKAEGLKFGNTFNAVCPAK